MREQEATFDASATTRFLIDRDRELTWLSEFPSGRFNRFFVMIDEQVNQVWGKQIFERLSAHGKEVFILPVKAEEDSKSIGYYPKAISFLEENICNRYDLVIAVGGGIVIDLASFLVSTYMRGLPLYVVATTLIGQVDASTAGKTCLNTDHAKNLLGTFYYPEVVYNNLMFLETNEPRHLRQGVSELFKYGLIGSPALVDMLVQYNKSPNLDLLSDIVDLGIKIRVEVRHRDPLASNLGHTFGQAIERYSDFSILHGDAISIGTVMAVNYATSRGIAAAGFADNVVTLMKELGLNIYVDDGYSADEIVDLMMRDKKSSSKNLNLVLVEDVGKPVMKNASSFYETDPQDVKDFLGGFLQSYEYKTRDCAGLLHAQTLSYD